MIRLLSLIVILITAAQNLSASDWTVDTANSRIGFAGTHAGSIFEGQFSDWSANISFDPDDLTTARAQVVIKTASAATGNTLYDTTLPGEDWFHTVAHTVAIFTADSFTQTGEDTYRADGTLQIRGTVHPISLDFTLKITGDAATMTAAHTLDRLAYGLGATSDPAADWVSKDIRLTFAVAARRQ